MSFRLDRLVFGIGSLGGDMLALTMIASEGCALSIESCSDDCPILGRWFDRELSTVYAVTRSIYLSGTITNFSIGTPSLDSENALTKSVNSIEC